MRPAFYSQPRLEARTFRDDSGCLTAAKGVATSGLPRRMPTNRRFTQGRCRFATVESTSELCAGGAGNASSPKQVFDTAQMQDYALAHAAEQVGQHRRRCALLRARTGDRQGFREILGIWLGSQPTGRLRRRVHQAPPCALSACQVLWPRQLTANAVTLQRPHVCQRNIVIDRVQECFWFLAIDEEEEEEVLCFFLMKEDFPSREELCTTRSTRKRRRWLVFSLLPAFSP